MFLQKINFYVTNLAIYTIHWKPEQQLPNAVNIFMHRPPLQISLRSHNLITVYVCVPHAGLDSNNAQVYSFPNFPMTRA